MTGVVKMKPYEIVKATFEINQKLLEFHRNKGFKIYESFPLVSDDSTLLFTNATITPFKKLFLELEKPHNYALVQHCLRVGGRAGNLAFAKVNPNYSSLFEMFGSGCFNYSHDEAVSYFLGMLMHAGIKPEELRFIAPVSGLLLESLINYGISPGKIFSLQNKIHFQRDWKFGKKGLLGSGITAIHVPKGIQVSSEEDLAAQPNVCVEIGNLIHVFGREDSCGKVVEIPNQGFEVGIGSARLAVILEGKSLWELPSFVEIFTAIEVEINKQASTTVSTGTIRFITDHLRTIASLIIDEVRPGNKREEFILRKMIRTYYEVIWIALGDICDTEDIIKKFLDIFSPENLEKVTHVILQEESIFRRTLARGSSVLKSNPNIDRNYLMSTFGLRSVLIPILLANK